MCGVSITDMTEADARICRNANIAAMCICVLFRFSLRMTAKRSPLLLVEGHPRDQIFISKVRFRENN